MLENLKQKEGIEYGHDVGEPEIKRRDRIRARCQRTQNKKKGSNPGTMPENPKEKKGSNPGTMSENSNQNKGSNSGAMPENPKKNEGIESRRYAGEPETKEGIRILARCRRNRNKRRDSNPSAMPENPKQNEGIKSGHDAREPETKEGIERVQKRKEGAMPQSKASIPCQKRTTAHKVKVTKLEILQIFIP